VDGQHALVQRLLAQDQRCGPLIEAYGMRAGGNMTKAIGLVGCGRWGSNHLRTLQRLKAEGAIHRLVVCDIDAQKLLSIDVDATYTSMDKMLSKESLNGVAIVTPLETHLALVQRAFDAHLPVFVEKPLSGDDDANQRFLNGMRGNETMVVGYILRHHSGVQHLLTPEVLKRIGPVVSVSYIRRTMRSKPKGMDPLTTLAIHGLDLVAISLDANLLTLDVKEKMLEDSAARVRLIDAQGRDATVDVAWHAESEVRIFEIEGVLGQASLDFGTGESTVTLHHTEPIRTNHQGDALDREWRYFLERIGKSEGHTFPSAERLLDQSRWLGLHAAR